MYIFFRKPFKLRFFPGIWGNYEKHKSSDLSLSFR